MRSNSSMRKRTVRPHKLIKLSLTDNKNCMFCGKNESSEMLYGLLYQLDNVVVHLYCILLSEKSAQNGRDHEGVCGFLLKDITAELKRASKVICCYCGGTGASIACSKPECQKVFHLPCGLENGSMHQYFGLFNSFCDQHRITQVVDPKELNNHSPTLCGICKENTSVISPTSVWAPCCKNNAWFHRNCVQEMALNAGYFFKCPLCNNVDTFKKAMCDVGIYIPSRDASWETVPNAFEDLLFKPNTCDAEMCVCSFKEKRNFVATSGDWELIFCYSCGSSGSHRLCCTVINDDQKWFCSACRDIAGPRNYNLRTRGSNEPARITDFFTLASTSTSTQGTSVTQTENSDILLISDN